MKYLVALLLLSLSQCAPAQTVETPVSSLWIAPPDGTHTYAAGALQLGSDGILTSIPGQRVTIPPIKFLQTSVVVSFPPTTYYVIRVQGIRLYHKASGKGWVMPEHPIDVKLPKPLSVYKGHRVICTYSSPLAKEGKLSCTVK